MKSMSKDNSPKTWSISNWINLAIAVLSALMGAIGTQAANAANLV